MEKIYKMSTKIYNAYICKMGMPYLSLIIKELRKEYTEEVQKTILDIPFNFRKKCIEFYEDDSIVIYPLQNGDILFQEWRYRLRYSVNLPTFNLMLNFNKIEDYHYQDQSDPWYIDDYDDDKITKEEYESAIIQYEQREKDWNEVFGDGSWSPAETGFTIPYINDKIRLEWDK